jgi:hypothetical protein
MVTASCSNTQDRQNHTVQVSRGAVNTGTLALPCRNKPRWQARQTFCKAYCQACVRQAQGSTAGCSASPRLEYTVCVMMGKEEDSHSPSRSSPGTSA